MMRYKFTVVIGLLLLGVINKTSATEKQFQLKVPLTFDMVPRQDVSGSTVHCAVFSTPQMDQASLIGSGYNNNGLSGFIDANRPKSSVDIYVKFNADQGKKPSDATHYQCWLELHNAGEKCRPDRDNADKPEWCQSTNQDDQLLVSGEL